MSYYHHRTLDESVKKDIEEGRIVTGTGLKEHCDNYEWQHRWTKQNGVRTDNILISTPTGTALTYETMKEAYDALLGEALKFNGTTIDKVWAGDNMIYCKNERDNMNFEVGDVLVRKDDFNTEIEITAVGFYTYLYFEGDNRNREADEQMNIINADYMLKSDIVKHGDTPSGRPQRFPPLYGNRKTGEISTSSIFPQGGIAVELKFPFHVKDSKYSTSYTVLGPHEEQPDWLALQLPNGTRSSRSLERLCQFAKIIPNGSQEAQVASMKSERLFYNINTYELVISTLERADDNLSQVEVGMSLVSSTIPNFIISGINYTTNTITDTDGKMYSISYVEEHCRRASIFSSFEKSTKQLYYHAYSGIICEISEHTDTSSWKPLKVGMTLMNNAGKKHKITGRFNDALNTETRVEEGFGQGIEAHTLKFNDIVSYYKVVREEGVSNAGKITWNQHKVIYPRLGTSAFQTVQKTKEEISNMYDGIQTCTHPRKRKTDMIFSSFMYCPDCKQEVK